jgi:hypothetical protein
MAMAMAMDTVMIMTLKTLRHNLTNPDFYAI